MQRGVSEASIRDDARWEAGLNYLCAGYKHFSQHIDPHMRFMAAELCAGRAPVNIMRIVGPGSSGEATPAIDLRRGGRGRGRRR
jgi:hypothetical protein